MRHVLINYALENLAQKRGGGALVESLTASHDIGVADDQSLIDVHEALDPLAVLDERLAQVVECRFFAGFSEEDSARAGHERSHRTPELDQGASMVAS